MSEANLPSDHIDRCRRVTDLVRRWCQDDPITPPDEQELARALLKFILESPVCRKRLSGLARELGSRADEEGWFILGLIMARQPHNRLSIIMEDVLAADDATLLSECRRRIRGVAIHDAYQQLQMTDPNSFKILNSLWDALRGHPDLFVLLPDGGDPTHATVALGGQLRLEAQEITGEEMMRLLSEICSHHRNMPERLSALLSVVAGDPQWCAVVPLGLLFDAFRRGAELGILREEVEYSSHAGSSPLFKVALGRAADGARQALRERLAKNVSGNHFSESEGRALTRAIDCLIDECVGTGRWPREMKEYLKLQLPDLTDDQYRSRFKARYQYLVSLAESTFFLILAREYGD